MKVDAIIAAGFMSTLFVENDDPLIFYRRITENAAHYLKAGGWLYFEIHEDNADGVTGLFAQNGFVNIEVRKDLQDKLKKKL